GFSVGGHSHPIELVEDPTGAILAAHTRHLELGDGRKGVPRRSNAGIAVRKSVGIDAEYFLDGRYGFLTANGLVDGPDGPLAHVRGSRVPCEAVISKFLDGAPLQVPLQIGNVGE